MRKWAIYLLTVVFAVSSVASVEARAPKAGAKCSKLGSKVISKNLEFQCVKKGKRNVWSKGKEVRQSSPSTTSSSSAPPVPTPDPTRIQYSATDSSLLDPLIKCLVPRRPNVGQEVGQYGYPQSTDFLKARGNIKGLIIPVEFPNARAKVNPELNSRPYVEDFEAYWKEMSRGTLNIKVDILDNWILMPENSGFYAGSIPYTRMNSYAQKAIELADPFVDFSKYQIVYIIPPDDVPRFFEFAPVVSSGKWEGFKSNEGPINNLIVGADPKISMGGVKWLWLAHETGHIFGIDHPHSYEGDDVTLASIFSLMDSGFVAPGLYGWERFLTGWVEESQIRCVDARSANNGSSIHIIKPLGTSSAPEMILIRISEYEAIIIENRRKNRFDLLPKNYEGTLIYKLNSSLEDGPIRPVLGEKFIIDYSKPEYNGDRVVPTYQAGASVSVGSVEITVLAEVEEDLVIRVTVAGSPVVDSRPAPTQTPTASPTPTPTPSPTPTVIEYTRADVAQRNTPNNCWTIINNNVYDLTSWISAHPGGPSAIRALCGIDGSATFRSMHENESRPMRELNRYLLGPLKS